VRYRAAALLSFWLFAIPLAAQTFVYVHHGCPQPCNPAGYVSVFEGTNRIATIPIPSEGFGLTAWRNFAATPNGKYMLMTGGAVTVFDLKTSTIVTQITDIPAANSVAISPDSRWAWVGSGFGTIGKIDLLTLKTVAYITRPDYVPNSGYSFSGGLTLSRDGRFIYVVDKYTHLGAEIPTISVIDTSTSIITVRLTSRVILATS
jgi:WD40 repeat protein